MAHCTSSIFKNAAPATPIMIANEFVAAIDAVFRTKTGPPIETRMLLHANIELECAGSGKIGAPIYYGAREAIVKNLSREAVRISNIMELLDLYWWTRTILRPVLMCAKPMHKTWLNCKRSEFCDAVKYPSLRQFTELKFVTRVLAPHLKLLTVPAVTPRAESSVREKEEHTMLYMLSLCALRYPQYITEIAGGDRLLERLAPYSKNSLYHNWIAFQMRYLRQVRAAAQWRLHRARVFELCSGLGQRRLPNELLVQIFAAMHWLDLDDEFGTRYRIVAAVTLCTRAHTSNQ